MDKTLEELVGLDFDQFSRIYDAKITIERLRGPKKTLKILDVGGYKGNTSRLFPSDDVTVVDQHDVHEAGYIKADATDLPFHDGEFDAVLSFDVFEHIPPVDRLKFLEEVVRVSKGLVIIAAPFMNKGNELAERLTNDFYKKIAGKDHPWLIEHIENSLPEESVVTKFLSAKKIQYRVVKSNEVVLWTYMQHFILLAGVAGVEVDLSSVNKFYNENRDSLDIVGEHFYRSVYIIGESDAPKQEKPQTLKDGSLKGITLANIIFKNIADILLEKDATITELNKRVALLSLEKQRAMDEAASLKRSRICRYVIVLRKLAKRIKRVVKNGR